ncbi:hypothetical protein M569_04769 [Genlisea aurea]|uniref:DNA mismatch repair protein MSH2 n=1 Tax=Genlisea aurea TaxID=192259 RepID=S8CRX1_9LAMI|nr:hypothetical protein M569_04769 [Genlisea aurea]
MDENSEPNNLPEFKLDAKQAQGLLSFFRSLPSDSRAVRFFDRREYYTTHGENAIFIAKAYYGTTTVVRQLGTGSDTLSGVSLSKSMFEIVARDLLLERKDHTVELYQGSGANWRLAKKASPGNFSSFEEVLFATNEMQDSPVIAAVSANFQESGCLVGLSYIDATGRVLGLSEFLDDNHFTNLESALVALGCKECLVPPEAAKSREYRQLIDVLSRCGAMATERGKADFKARDLLQDVGRLVKGPPDPTRDLLAGFGLAAGALACIISYTDLLGDESNYSSYTIRRYDLGSYMRLDSAAMRALNVMESKTDANKNFSLFGLLNRTCTAGMGKRLLHVWLKQPLLDISEINCRLDLVQAFVEDPVLRQNLRQNLKRISDIQRLVRSLEKRKATLVHVVKLYQSTIRLSFIRDGLKQYEGEFSSLINERYLSNLGVWTDDDHLNKFIGLVEASVDLEQLENGEYMISSSYDSHLSDLKKEQESLEQQIRSLHQKTADDLDMAVDKSLKLEKATQYGHAFRITKKEEPKVRKQLNTHFVVLETRKDGVKFTNTKLRKLSDLYQKVLEEYKDCQKVLVARVVQTAASFAEVFEGVACLLSELDVLLSFADLASSSPTPYTRPTITPSDAGDIILEGSRHPCVEAQDWVNFIPNDCKLVRGQSWFQIITGPNMGGKSTFIRQIGVNIMMAQIGCFVPCDSATISVRDCIFARVGAGDCQMRGVSTFMQEMLETASILKGATDKSLIIIDELGRGTSTYDGFGIAWAICEHIVEAIGAPTLFASHFHELTALAHDRHCGIANYHVSAHIDESNRKLTMLYKVVEPGPCDQSFGIHVAEFANFPESVVALSRKKASELEDFSPVTATTSGCKRKHGDQRRQSDDVRRGVDRALEFLKKFAELPLEGMDLKRARERVRSLKEDLRKDASSCRWLQQFF